MQVEAAAPTKPELARKALRLAEASSIDSTPCFSSAGFGHAEARLLLKLLCQKQRLFYYGEFDPGSGRTLAASLTHASRTRSWSLRAPVGEWRTGE